MKTELVSESGRESGSQIKSLTLIAGSENTARVLCAQLAEYFGDGVRLQTLWVTGGLSEPVNSPVVVLSSYLVGDELARSGFIPADARVIVGRRIVDCDGLERVVSLPPGTKALFVNDRPETARDCVESLVSLGMDGIRWMPWHPGCPKPPLEYQVAVVAGEPSLVPHGIPAIIDIGVRIFDFASLSEILASVGLKDRDVDRFPRRYLSRIVNLAGRLATSIDESRRLNVHLGSVIDSLRHGIIVYDRDGRISICNEELRSILNLRFSSARSEVVRAGAGRTDPARSDSTRGEPGHGDLSGNEASRSEAREGSTLAGTIRSRELLNFLTGRNGEDTGVFRLPEGNIIVHRMDLGVSGHTMATFRGEVDTTAEAARLAREYRRLGHVAKWGMEDIVGESEAIRRAKRIASRLAVTELTILIHGESGTGKELFASGIHATSKRASGPFLAVDLGAFSDDLIESELFGYREGAFTGARKGGKPGLFELADGGTLFLDEIGNISPKVQKRLLRVLQEKEIMRVGGSEIIKVDVRIITATNEDLLEKTRERTFREDLYYRLKMGWLSIPALRERKVDIPLLVRRFLSLEGASAVGIQPEVLSILQERDWPGNVRELRNALTYMLAVREGTSITVKELPEEGYFAPVSRAAPAATVALEVMPESAVLTASAITRDRACRSSSPAQDQLTREERFVLKAIGRLSAQGNAAGRDSVSKEINAHGVRMGSGAVRSRMERLGELGMIAIQRGRSGSILTIHGKEALDFIDDPRPAKVHDI